jgi:hypothetical protein
MTSFVQDIRPLFTAEDVEHMLRVKINFDLSNYESVRANANVIYHAVSHGLMPPGQPWPQERVDRFKRWMDEGYPP